MRNHFTARVPEQKPSVEETTVSFCLCQLGNRGSALVESWMSSLDQLFLSVFRRSKMSRLDNFLRPGRLGSQFITAPISQAKPQKSGIECVGIVKSCPGGEFAEGTKVAAFMGGLGRTINGSYAEYTFPPATNVVPIKTDLPWEEFAVIPESYATAWTCLLRNLEITKGQTLVIRGATSALGRAAVNIAADAGAHIIATTRKKARFETLKELGAHRVEIEMPNLSELIPERKRIDAVLDLVDNSTFMDSLRMLRRGGRMCLAGWLGGLDPLNDFNPLLQMPSGVYFTFFGSFVFGTPDFPVSDVPLQVIVDKAAAETYKAKPARVFQFDEIREAHEAMESN
jgi:NADPH:quinone reductase